MDGPRLTVVEVHDANTARLNDEIAYLRSKLQAMKHYLQHLPFCSKSPCSCGLEDMQRLP